MTGDSKLVTPPSDRLITLDVLRGVAIFGILLVNIQSFGLPGIARTNPSVYGSFTGFDYVTWLLTHVFAEGKFITIFTILFGAGVMLFTDKKDAEGTSTTYLHYRRMFWLLVIGLAHAYLLWDGDILVAYAVSGSIIVWARHWQPVNQLLIGIGIALVTPLHWLSFAIEGTTAVLSGWTPSQAAIHSEIAAYQADWLPQTTHRIATATQSQTVGYIAEGGWQVTGLMLIGMALYRYGVLSGDRDNAFYTRLATIALSLGVTTTLLGVALIEHMDWHASAALYWNAISYGGGILTGIGYIAIIVQFARSHANAVTRTFAAIGRTALSNYILQSLLATLLFYGHGLGLFATLNRTELLVVVVGIWAVQIIATRAWLHWFTYGPLERVWRTLTYW